MTGEQDALSAALDESPGDLELRLVYADWFEEQGRLSVARFHRWLAKEKKWPAFVPHYPVLGMAAPAWKWVMWGRGSRRNHQIPRRISDGWKMVVRVEGFSTRTLAETNLMIALTHAKILTV